MLRERRLIILLELDSARYEFEVIVLVICLLYISLIKKKKKKSGKHDVEKKKMEY